MMPGYRLIKPSIVIDGSEFKCMSKSVDFAWGDFQNFCDRDLTVNVDIELSFGATGSFNTLDAMRGQVKTVVISPSDGTVDGDNPSATFTAEIPPVPLMTSAGRGEVMPFTLELVAREEPVIAYS